MGQPPFGVESRCATAGGRCDGLPVAAVDQVAGGEDTVDRGVGGAIAGPDVPARGEVEPARQELRSGGVSDRDDDGGNGLFMIEGVVEV